MSDEHEKPARTFVRPPRPGGIVQRALHSPSPTGYVRTYLFLILPAAAIVLAIGLLVDGRPAIGVPLAVCGIALAVLLVITRSSQ